jgi:hypothetical protein
VIPINYDGINNKGHNMSKGYTINYYTNLFKSASPRNLTPTNLPNFVSPVYGSSSVKFSQLDGFLGGNIFEIARGHGDFASFGKTPRARILKALSLRKKHGFVI